VFYTKIPVRDDGMQWVKSNNPNNKKRTCRESQLLSFPARTRKRGMEKPASLAQKRLLTVAATQPTPLALRRGTDNQKIDRSAGNARLQGGPAGKKRGVRPKSEGSGGKKENERTKRAKGSAAARRIKVSNGRGGGKEAK